MLHLPFLVKLQITDHNVTNFDINYSINGGAAVTENITGVNIDG